MRPALGTTPLLAQSPGSSKEKPDKALIETFPQPPPEKNRLVITTTMVVKLKKFSCSLSIRKFLSYFGLQ